MADYLAGAPTGGPGAYPQHLYGYPSGRATQGGVQ